MRGIDKLFTFEQLSKVSQIEAFYNERDAIIKAGYRYADESLESLFEFAKILNSKVVNFSVHFYNIEASDKSHCEFKYVKPDDVELLEITKSISRADGYFTGHYSDIHLYRCLRELVYDHLEENPNIILAKCFSAWLKGCREEAEAYLSEDYLTRKFIICEFLFLEDGTFFSRGNRSHGYLV